MADIENQNIAEPAVTTCFGVKVDEHDLGSFTSCEGLGVEVVMEQREEGGNNSVVWQLPTRIKYTNIKLSRAITDDSTAVLSWLAKFADDTGEQTATITALTASGDTVASWDLQGVIPVRWTGPSLNADSPKVATESLELAHHGFTSTRD